MTRSQIAARSLILAAALTACSAEAPSVNAELDRDLAAVRATAVDMAPRAPERIMVVSAEEQVGTAQPVRAASRPAPRRATAPRVTAPRVTAPVAVADVDDSSTEPAPAIATETASTVPEPVVSGPLRLPRPQATPEPRGGYRSVSDVIRNAPFPINP